MKFLEFLEGKISFILFQITFILINNIFLIIFNINHYFIIYLSLILLIYLFLYLGLSYYKINKKEKAIIKTVDELEEKYLIAEIIDKPKSLENTGYYYALKSACKSMNDKISYLEKEKQDYEEYIESFAHDIKTPISALSLVFENKKAYKLKDEVKQIDNLVEQILYYARLDVVEKDYFIKELVLDEVIHNIMISYKEYFLRAKVKLDIHNLDNVVYTDEKWLIFIVSQIIQNSIKYFDKELKKLEIYSINDTNKTVLFIKDNGCGIKKSDINRVFEKGFTGSNRYNHNSTGMGLYLVKKLVNKLGLEVNIESVEKEYTKLIIVFPKNNIYKIKD